MKCAPGRDHGKRERRAAEHTARKSGRNQLMRDLAREVAGAPDEVRCLFLWPLIVAPHCGSALGEHSMWMVTKIQPIQNTEALWSTPWIIVHSLEGFRAKKENARAVTWHSWHSPAGFAPSKSLSAFPVFLRNPVFLRKHIRGIGAPSCVKM